MNIVIQDFISEKDGDFCGRLEFGFIEGTNSLFIDKVIDGEHQKVVVKGLPFVPPGITSFRQPRLEDIPYVRQHLSRDDLRHCEELGQSVDECIARNTARMMMFTTRSNEFGFLLFWGSSDFATVVIGDTHHLYIEKGSFMAYEPVEDPNGLLED